MYMPSSIWFHINSVANSFIHTIFLSSFMMAASKAFIAAVATIALVIQSVAAADNFTVGAPGGSWDRNTNFTSWAASKKFVVGDNLIFNYPPQQHNVLEVTKANYDSCSAGGPISSHATGNDVIPLPAAATRYFICGVPGHCQGGMKVAVTVVAGAAAPATQPASSPAPSTPGSSPPASSPPPSSSSPRSSPTASPPSSTSPGSSPAGSSPAPTSPGNSAPSPTTSSSPPPPPPPGTSGASGRSLQAKAAVGFGFGIGMLMVLAL